MYMVLIHFASCKSSYIMWDFTKLPWISASLAGIIWIPLNQILSHGE